MLKMIATIGSKHIQHILCDISDDDPGMRKQNHKSKLKKSKHKKGINSCLRPNVSKLRGIFCRFFESFKKEIRSSIRKSWRNGDSFASNLPLDPKAHEKMKVLSPQNIVGKPLSN